jgi:hypothetical protein
VSCAGDLGAEIFPRLDGGACGDASDGTSRASGDYAPDSVLSASELANVSAAVVSCFVYDCVYC